MRANFKAFGPTAEFDLQWKRGYITGRHLTGVVLAGLGLPRSKPMAVQIPAGLSRAAFTPITQSPDEQLDGQHL